jgi:chaperonin GroES
MSVAATVAKRIMPLFDRVLVQRAVAETKTKGGLIIPEAAQKSPLEATVVAAGPGARNASTGETIPMSVAVGDRVLMPEWGSNKLEMDGQEFHVIRETDIVAKLAD